MSDLPPKFVVRDGGTFINLSWEAELQSINALGEFEEVCAACGEEWGLYCDTRRGWEGEEEARNEQGRTFGDVWVCEVCLATFEAVSRAISNNS